MLKKRLTVWLLVIFLCVSLFTGFLGVLPLAPVYATPEIIDSYTSPNSQYFLQDYHPSDSADKSAVGQSFTMVSSAKQITSAKFMLYKSGSPTGNAYVKLYDHSGVYGTSSKPTGSPLATSNAFDVSTLTTGTTTWVTFTFSGAEQYVMTADAKYCIVFENPASGTIDSSNYVWHRCRTTDPDHSGNLFWYSNGAWSAFSGADTMFYVYGDTPVYPTNDACDSDGTFTPNVYGWSNMTVSDADGVTDLKTVDIQVTTSGSEVFTLRWTQSTGVFSEVSDPNGICTLNVSKSTRTNIDSDTDLISFNFNISTVASSGYCSVTATTKDDLDIQDIDTYSAEFYISSFYEYTFYGLYDENTGLLKPIDERAVNVTAFWDDGTTAEPFEVNGTHHVGYYTSPQYFFFDLGTNDREYWLSLEEGEATTIDIYIFGDTLTQYYISFNDLTGSLETYSWVSASRYINGTLTVMDKRKVDVEKKFTMSLQNGKTYTIQVEAEAGTPYTFGDLLMTTDTTVDLTIKGIEFPTTIILTYKYLRVYATRDNTTIVVTYENTQGTTTAVDVYIRKTDETVVASQSYSTDSFSYTWSSANSSLTYVAYVSIETSNWGNKTYTNILPPASIGSAPDWSLDILGTLPFDTAYLIPMFIILGVAAVFSVLTLPIGCIMVSGVATLLYGLEWIPRTSSIEAYLVVAWALSVLTAIMWAKKENQV